MLRLNQVKPTVMEFTTFTKADNITDEDFISLVIKFEHDYLKNQPGLLFHCLVRNLNGEYANLLFADNIQSIKDIENGFSRSDIATEFMKSIKPSTVKVYYHEILKDNFQVPDNFACVEHGIFSPKVDSDFSEESLLSVSKDIENTYLNTFENTLSHFMGKVDNGTYSEITFGKTLGKTKDICYGYFNIESGMKMMNMCDPETTNLDFWYLIA
jgi:hypothetical protein